MALNMHRRVLGLVALALSACHHPQQTPSNTCSALSDPWPQASVDFENEVIGLVNAQRALGASCGTSGLFAAKPPLIPDARLACAARGHAKDMVVNNYFAHNSQNGESPFQRMTDAGYTWSNAGENIAGGFPTPQDVMNGWMNSEGHCANIMGDYVNIGVGYYAPDWVQDFATPS